MGNKYINEGNPIYFSYARNDSLNQHISDAVDLLLEKFKNEKIQYSVDIEDIQNGDNISLYEKEIAEKGNNIVLVFSDKYFHSMHCMYEFVNIKKQLAVNPKKKNVYFIKSGSFDLKDENYIDGLINFWSEKAGEYQKIKLIGKRKPSQIENAMAQNGFYIEDIRHLYEFFSANNWTTSEQIVQNDCSIFLSQIKKNMFSTKTKDKSFLDAISAGIKNSFTFEGNATIKEFWFYVLFYWIFMYLFSKIVGCSNEDFIDYITTIYNSIYYMGYILANHDVIIYSKYVGLVILQILFFPSLLSLSVRRLHDVGINGMVNIVYFLPILLTLILKLYDNLGNGFLYDFAEWFQYIVSIIFVALFCMKKSS